MRVMVCVPANADSEAGKEPPAEMVEQMLKYNEQLVKAGVMLDGAGLAPTSKSKRVRFDGSKRTVIDGPFAESKELVAGYWIWNVKSIDEAVEWLQRAPFGGGVEITIRPIAGLEDYQELPKALLDKEAKLRDEIAARRS